MVLFVKRAFGLILTGALVFSSMTVVSASSDIPKNYEPREEVINGVTHLDGIPYYSEKDLKNLDKMQKEKSGKEEKREQKKSDITTQGVNSWTQTSSSTYYTGQDRDRMNFETDTPPAVVTLKTYSQTTASITGSTSFDFASVAQASMSVSIGTTWGKEYTYTINPKPWYVYELKSACRVTQRDYEYEDTSWWSGSDYYYASSHDKYGTEHWFWSNPIN
jgi:hypothetical protein